MDTVDKSLRNNLFVSMLILCVPTMIVAVLAGVNFNAVILPILLGAVVLPLPLTDSGTVRYQTFPWVTIALIVINTVLLFWWQGYLNVVPYLTYVDQYGYPTTTEAANAFNLYEQHIWIYGIRTRYILDGFSIGAFSSLTSIFMHAEHTHLVGNMIFLWAFGRRLEDACGHFRYLIFYLLAGVIAGIGAMYLTPVGTYEYDVPGIGASGAIFGVMGAYLILFPTSRVLCWWIPGVFPIRPIIMALGHAMEEETYRKWRWTINVHAIFVIGAFALLNLSEGSQIWQGEALSNAGGTIAHVSGFLASILIFLFVRKDLLRRYFAGRNL